jgi:hypothetical protein
MVELGAAINVHCAMLQICGSKLWVVGVAVLTCRIFVAQVMLIAQNLLAPSLIAEIRAKAFLCRLYVQ